MKRTYEERTKKRCLIDALKILAILFTIIAVMIGIELLVEGLTVVKDLTVNFETEPMGVSTESEPHFSWNMSSKVKGQAQKTYEIRIFEGEDGSGNPIWTSGEVESGDTMYIRAEGLILEKEKRYSWRVYVQPTWGWKVVSKAATFVTETDFSETDWIIPIQEDNKVSLVRTQAEIRRMTIREAYLYITAMGNYRAYVEGKEVRGTGGSQTVLAPGLTDYNHTVTYQTYDVTENFRDNLFDNKATIGIALSKGWYGDDHGESSLYEAAFGPDDSVCEMGTAVRLILRYADGTTQTISTGSSGWYSGNYSGVEIGGIKGMIETDVPDGATAGISEEAAEESGESGEENSEDTPSAMTRRIGSVSCMIDNRAAAVTQGWTGDDYIEQVDKWTGVTIAHYGGTIVPSYAGTARIADEYEQKYETAYCYHEADISDVGSAGRPYGEALRHEPNTVEKEKDAIRLVPGEKLICDFGKYLSGQVDVTVSGEAGTVITLTYAERLNEGPSEDELTAEETDGRAEISGEGSEDGTAGGDAAETAEEPDGPIGSIRLDGAVTNIYVLGGDEEEEFFPRETYQGYRYVEIETDEILTIRKITGKVFTSQGRKTGEIRTSNDDINRIIESIAVNRLANDVSVPNRSVRSGEREGSLTFAQILELTDLYTADTRAFFDHFIATVQEQGRQTEGIYGLTAPLAEAEDNMNVAGGSDAGIIIPWQLYQMTGNTAVLEEHFNDMATYMNRVYTESYEIPLNGDFLAIAGTSGKYMAEIYRMYDTEIMQKVSEALEREDFAAAYEERLVQFREDFMNKYLDEEGNILSASADGLTEDKDGTPIVDNSQTALFWALKLGLFRNEDQRVNMLANLVSGINNPGSMLRPGDAEDTLNVGLLGIGVALPVLSEYGYTDLACDLLKTKDYPSWLYDLDHEGAGRNPYGYAMDSVGEWMYRYLAGIAPDPERPGLTHIILQPAVDSGRTLTSVKASYESMAGTIRSGWDASGGKIRSYTCEVPANAAATLYLPISKEQADSMRVPRGAEYTGTEKRNGQTCAVYELISGTYRFRVPME